MANTAQPCLVMGLEFQVFRFALVLSECSHILLEVLTFKTIAHMPTCQFLTYDLQVAASGLFDYYSQGQKLDGAPFIALLRGRTAVLFLLSWFCICVRLQTAHRTVRQSDCHCMLAVGLHKVRIRMISDITLFRCDFACSSQIMSSERENIVICTVTAADTVTENEWVFGQPQLALHVSLAPAWFGEAFLQLYRTCACLWSHLVLLFRPYLGTQCCE